MPLRLVWGNFEWLSLCYPIELRSSIESALRLLGLQALRERELNVTLVRQRVAMSRSYLQFGQ